MIPNCRESAMATVFRKLIAGQRFLLPVDMQDWLPESDFVHLVPQRSCAARFELRRSQTISHLILSARAHHGVSPTGLSQDPTSHDSRSDDQISID
jgi:hypothetical protein